VGTFFCDWLGVFSRGIKVLYGVVLVIVDRSAWKLAKQTRAGKEVFLGSEKGLRSVVPADSRRESITDYSTYLYS